MSAMRDARMFRLKVVFCVLEEKDFGGLRWFGGSGARWSVHGLLLGGIFDSNVEG